MSGRAGPTGAARALAAAALAAVALVGAARGARAGDPPADDPHAEAKRLAAQAQVHFDLAEYPEAIEAYRAAYRLDPRPGLLYNLAQAYRLDGDCLTAVALYQRYLALAPDSKVRPLVEQHLEALDACARERDAAGARPRDDLDAPAPDGPRAGAAIPGDAPAAATPVVVASPDLVRPAPARGRRLRLAGIASGATGAALAAAGAWFAIDAGRAADEVSAIYARGGDWSEIEAIDARGRRSEVLGASLLATGGAALAAGVTLYVLGVRADRPDVVVAPARGGAEVSVSWRF